MPSPSDKTQFRTYDRASSVVFRKTNEEFGGLSNMAGGFPLLVNGLAIRTAEALYQACRFPHRPELQRHIIDQRSPMTAKMVGKPHRHDSRRDWDRVRVNIMRWTLRVKLAQNWAAFGDLLLATGDRPIVEDSRRDDFWGAKQVDSRTLAGLNVLGRLLMELREALREQWEQLLTVEPPAIADLLLDGHAIGVIHGDAADRPLLPVEREPEVVRQPSLFDQPSPPSNGTEPMPPTPTLTRTTLAPYPAYREADLPWLDEVPKHWEVRRLKAAVESVNEQITAEGGEAPYVALEHVEGWTGRVRPATGAPIGSAVRKFKGQDVLFGKLRPYLAKVARFSEPGVCVGEFLVLRPREDGTCSAYIELLLRSKPIIDAVNASTFGAKMPRADWTFVGSMAIPLPPPEEQAAIVRYLDHADRRIRRYIRAKQRLIALLEEQKQAIIHQAVTRGLAPDVRLKPSGVEWLGDIPEHWEVRKLRSLFGRHGSGTTPSGDDYYGGGIPWVMTGDLTDKELLNTKRTVNALALEQVSALRMYPPGSLLVAMYGATIGRTGVLAIAACTNQACCVLAQPRPDVNVNYVQAVVNTARSTLVEQSYGGGQPNINAEIVKSLRVPLPPRREQDEILSAIEGNRTNSAIDRARREIGLLHEYRTRLIADVVTGKLDVREAAARLPDESDDPELLDDLDTLDALDDLDADEIEAELEEAVT